MTVLTGREVLARANTKHCSVHNRLKELERGFLLDGVCLSHLANDETDRTFPSQNIGIPQYNALVSKNASNYFKRKGLPRFLKEREDSDKAML